MYNIKVAYNNLSKWDAKNHGLAQLSSAKKATMRNHFTLGGFTGLVCSSNGKHQHANCKLGAEKIKALAASFATLSQNINLMAVHMGAKQGKGTDSKPAANGKMGNGN